MNQSGRRKRKVSFNVSICGMVKLMTFVKSPCNGY